MLQPEKQSRVASVYDYSVAATSMQKLSAAEPIEAAEEATVAAGVTQEKRPSGSEADASTATGAGGRSIIIEGYLQKRGVWNTQWKTRWGSLHSSGQLRYYEPSGGRNGGNDKTKLSLKGICEVADATEIRIKPGNGGIRICCPSREWRFKVAPKELAMWARALANFARVLEV